METVSSINEIWKFSTFACFLGCITLFFILNHNHQNSNLLTLQNLGMSLKSPNNVSDTNFQVLEIPSSLEKKKQASTDHEEENKKQASTAHEEENKKQAITDHEEENKKQASTAHEEENKKQASTAHEEENKKQAITDHEEEKCNMFEGKWIYNPEGSPLYNGSQCPFLSEQVSCRKNGRSDFDYENWSWEAKGCKIQRFNGKETLEKLRGKRVIIVGDSLNRNQWESLTCLLYSAILPSQAYVDVNSGSYKVFRAKEYNCSVEFYWSPFLVELEVNKASGDRILRLDKLSASAEKWQGADIMVFDTGHWWVHNAKLQAWDFFQNKGKLEKEMDTESALSIAMETWSRWIERNVNASKTRVFFRSISPEHKRKQWCYNQTQPIIDDSYVTTFPKQMIQIVERTIQGMKTPVTYLNITNLSQYRRDAHPSIYRTKQGKTFVATKQKQPKSFADCSHWCLPGLPDTWNRLLLALVFGTSKDISVS